MNVGDNYNIKTKQTKKMEKTVISPNKLLINLALLGGCAKLLSIKKLRTEINIESTTSNIIFTDFNNNYFQRHIQHENY